MKKRMLLSTVLMTLVLLLAATTATFAWYQATQGAALNNVSSTETIDSASSSIAVGNYYVKVDLTADIAAVELSDKAGKTYVVSNGALALATAGTTKRQLSSTASDYTVTVSETEGGAALTGDALKAALAAIGEGTYVVNGTAGGYLRLTTTESSVYTCGLAQTVQIGTLSIAEVDGAYTITYTPANNVWYSISGAEVVEAAGTSATPDERHGNSLTISVVA